MAIFDTDILIWVQRGSEKAAGLIDRADERFLSVISVMELLQCAANKSQHETVRDFISKYNFQVLPLTENIGHRALIYVEEYTLSHHVRVADALIAATAVENNMPLISGNERHLKPIKELHFKVFKP